MPIVADAAVAVRGDLDRFNKDLKAGLGKGEKQAQSFGQRFNNLLSPGNLAGGLAAGFAGSQVISFLGDAVAAASELGETTSKVGVVFGEASDQIMELGETSARSLGMSRNAALSAAGTFGNLFRSMGITEDASADMSSGLVELAADLASFNNMDPTEVLDKLRAGLSGETEPLRSLGVNLSAAAINAKAMELGLASANGEVDAAAKAQATYALILEDTTLAQGDFDRTSGGLANQQRILAASLEDVTADIGTKLLPVMVELATFSNDTLVPAIQWLAENTDLLVDILGAIAPGIAAADIGGALEDEVLKGVKVLGEAPPKIGDALAGVPGAISGPFEKGGEDAVKAVDDMYVGIGQTAAVRESQLARAGGDAIAAWFQPAEVALARQELERQIAESNDEILELERSGTNAQVAEARARRLAYVRELMELQLTEATIGTAREQLTKLSAIRNGQNVIDGLNSADAGIAEAYRGYARILDDSIEAQELIAGKAQIGDELAGSLEGQAGSITAASKAATAGATEHLKQLAVQGEVWGGNLGDAYAKGLKSAAPSVRESANTLGYVVAGILGVASEPKDHSSPLYGHTQWMGNLVDDLVRDGMAHLGLAEGLGYSLGAALTPSVGGSLAMDSASRLATAGVGDSGSTVQNFYQLIVEGRPKVIGSRDDVLDAWEQEERF